VNFILRWDKAHTKSAALYTGVTETEATLLAAPIPGAAHIGNPMQLKNPFKLDDERRLVDLPGYGYAKVPIPLKQHWQRHLEAYLGGRESLKGLILMMDIRHPMTDFDLLMLDWAVAAGMPMHILLTKADKLTYGAAKNTLLKVQAEIRKGWGDLVTIQLFSAPKRMGLEDAYTVLAGWMELADKGAEVEAQ
jgi:GTP-binding protein